jgi:hypothetical protein
MEPALAPASPVESAPRGLLRIGGATLVRRQLALALASGCKRIACLARGIGPELIELQHVAEKAGASFHVIAGSHGLSGLITSADEVLVMAEGLLPAHAEALRLIDGPPVLLVQPAEIGIPAGFERIDLNHASAGLNLVPGRLADRLMDLPPDVDPGSALLRIALQAGISQRAVPDELVKGGRWQLIRSEPEAHAAEDGWMARHTAQGPATPGCLIARSLVRHFGPAMLHGGNSPLAGIAAAALLAALGLGATWFGWASSGFLLVGLGWVLCRAALLLDGLRRAVLAEHAGPALLPRIAEAAFDLAFIAALVQTATVLPGQMPAERLFAPVMVMGLLRVVAHGPWASVGAWASDRLVTATVLAAFAIGRVLDAGIPLLAVCLLAGLLVPRQIVTDELTPA